MFRQQQTDSAEAQNSRYPPIRPSRPTHEEVPEPLRAPTGPPDANARDSPSALAPEPNLPQAGWPSQIQSTMWLLPPSTDQSSAIALLLRTEIQSHNITREMLHNTEQRRLQAVNFNERLQQDCRGWAAAYEKLSETLRKVSEEYLRLSSENMAMREKAQPETSADKHVEPPPESQTRLLWNNLGRDGAGQDQMCVSNEGSGLEVECVECDCGLSTCTYSASA